jgi:hypothetical protein
VEATTAGIAMSDIHEPRPVGPSFGYLGAIGSPPPPAAMAWVDPTAQAADTSEPADWIAERLLPMRDHVPVGAIVPTGFDAYARVLHPAGGGGSSDTPIRWSEVAAWSGRVIHPEVQWEAVSRASSPASKDFWKYDPALGQCPLPVRRVLVERLRAFTRSTWCWAAVWEGWGCLPPYPEIPKLRLPGRSYFLLSCPWQLIESSIFRGAAEDGAAPSLWWPPDRSWFVATEIDFRWTYVAGSHACISALLADDRLETLGAHVRHRADYLSDTINGPVSPF